VSSSRLVSEKRAVQEMSVENKTASFSSLVLCFAIFVRKRHVTGLRPCVMLPNIEHKHIAVFFRVGGGGLRRAAGCMVTRVALGYLTVLRNRPTCGLQRPEPSPPPDAFKSALRASQLLLNG